MLLSRVKKFPFARFLVLFFPRNLSWFGGTNAVSLSPLALEPPSTAETAARWHQNALCAQRFRKFDLLESLEGKRKEVVVVELLYFHQGTKNVPPFLHYNNQVPFSGIFLSKEEGTKLN